MRKNQKHFIEVFDNNILGSKVIAEYIVRAVRKRQEEGRLMVLGLATGSTPKMVYEELVRLHKREGVSFRNVITFNLDEYYPMKANSKNSYVHYMYHHLFDHIDIPQHHIHIPDGTIPIEELSSYCASYDTVIKSVGGIDLQLLGIGRTGHIGFNEPPAQPTSGTRLVELHPTTREDAINDFGGLNLVPEYAITMGIGSILQAKEIIIAGWGRKKANIVREAIYGNKTETIPASYLQEARSVKWILDKEAASLIYY